MKSICKWFFGLSKLSKDSLLCTSTLCCIVSTISSIIGISLKDFVNCSMIFRIGIVIISMIIIYWIFYHVIGYLFRKSISLEIRGISVCIMCGDIFKEQGLKVIGCDTHFDTRIDDIIISKNSLHGNVFLNHANIKEICIAVENESKRLGLKKNNNMYDFPLGTIIRYDSKKDNNTYLLLAMTELNDDHEAHTNMAKYELMLMKMWKEISRVYAGHDIVLPLLGAGISRFDDGPKNKEILLRCMLCTLNSSGVSLSSNIKIIINKDIEKIPLYEYKDIFYTIIRS